MESFTIYRCERCKTVVPWPDLTHTCAGGSISSTYKKMKVQEVPKETEFEKFCSWAGSDSAYDLIYATLYSGKYASLAKDSHENMLEVIKLWKQENASS